jgi:cytochrome c oxidase subunit 2
MRARNTAKARLGALTAGLALILTACSKTNIPQDTLNPAGPGARKIDALFHPVFWIAVGVFVLVEGLLVFALVRFRHRPGRETPVQVHGNKRLEIGWTIAPSLLLAGVAVFTIPVIFDLAAKPANALEITVTGHQWWWEVQYPSMKLVTANEIHIPVNRPVYVTVKSVDVIHSFWVPRLAGKQDLEPGRENHLTIEAETAGTYEGQCAEYCGASHANMRLKVFAQTPGDFDRWVQLQTAPPAEPPAGSLAAEGEQVFLNGRFLNNQQCQACHTNRPGVGGTVGPNLSHFGGRTSFAGSTFPNNPAALARWLDDPPAVKPGVDMPYLGLSSDQVRALVAYLESLK